MAVLRSCAMPLAVTSAKRLSLLPEYPTVAETGYPGYESGNWYGIMVPAKTPQETIATIRGAGISVLKNPVVSNPKSTSWEKSCASCA